MHRIVSECGLHKSGFRSRDMVMPEERLVFNAALQNVANWLYGECGMANYPGWQAMNEEAYSAKIAEDERKKSDKKKKQAPDEK